MQLKWSTRFEMTCEIVGRLSVSYFLQHDCVPFTDRVQQNLREIKRKRKKKKRKKNCRKKERRKWRRKIAEGKIEENTRNVKLSWLNTGQIYCTIDAFGPLQPAVVDINLQLHQSFVLAPQPLMDVIQCYKKFVSPYLLLVTSK